MSVKVEKTNRRSILEKLEMSVEVAKMIRIVLLCIAFIACIVGVVLSQNAAQESQEAEQKAATDISQISVQVIDRSRYYKQYESLYVDGYYHIDFTYKITNNTKVDWAYLEITTEIYDKRGKYLGYITSKIGSSFGSSDLKLKVGNTITKIVEWKESQPDDFFMSVYDTPLSDLKFECVVTYGSYYK